MNSHIRSFELQYKLKIPDTKNHELGGFMICSCVNSYLCLFNIHGSNKICKYKTKFWKAVKILVFCK